MGNIKNIATILIISSFPLNALFAQKGKSDDAKIPKIKNYSAEISTNSVIQNVKGISKSPEMIAQTRVNKLSKQVTNLSQDQKKKAFSAFLKETNDANLSANANTKKVESIETSLKSILSESQMKEYKSAEMAERKERLQRVIEKKPDITIEK